MAQKCSLVLEPSNGFVFHSMPRHFGFGCGMLQNPKKPHPRIARTRGVSRHEILIPCRLALFFTVSKLLRQHVPEKNYFWVFTFSRSLPTLPSHSQNSQAHSNTMNQLTSLLAVATATISLQCASAGLITYTTPLDNSYDGSMTFPSVGSISFSYNRSSALADGFYTFSYLNTFSPALSVSFNNGSNFTLPQLAENLTNTGVYLSGSSFLLATTPNYMGLNPPFVITFVDGVYESSGRILSVEALWVNHLGSTFYSPLRNVVWGSGSDPGYGYYSMSTWNESISAYDATYFGNYGFDISSVSGGGGGGTSAVPEPGQVATSLLLLTGIGGYVFLKRRKANCPATL